MNKTVRHISIVKSDIRLVRGCPRKEDITLPIQSHHNTAKRLILRLIAYFTINLSTFYIRATNINIRQ